MKLEIKNGIAKDINGSKILHQIKLLCQQLPLLTVQEIETKLNDAKQMRFEFANKPGSWLAHKLRTGREKKAIEKTQKGDMIITDLI